MTKNNNGLTEDLNSHNALNKKLSIQVSLNGLSFCILDNEDTIISSKKVVFENVFAPYQLTEQVQSIIEGFGIDDEEYAEVTLIHNNNFHSLVPKELFVEDHLPHYLKFNTRLSVNDIIAYDAIESHQLVNVYLPFNEINNYVIAHFNNVSIVHSGSILIQTLLNKGTQGQAHECYVNVMAHTLEIVVLFENKLLLYNQFEYSTKEDFLYFILLVLEQLQIDPEKVLLNLFGDIEEGDELFVICYDYIKNVSIFIPENPYRFSDAAAGDYVEYAVLNSF